jgi:cob(I)alamin adenosyltransferase
MVKINRIYTRTGDDGSTGLVGGERISKAAPRVDAYGDIDELNSWLGFATSLMTDPTLDKIPPILRLIQNELFDIGSELASTQQAELSGLPLIGDERVAQLEKWIDEFSGNLPELRSFVLPGGHQVTGALHIARTVCRRAERSMIRVHSNEAIRDVTIRYVNRLSDLLFSLCRYTSSQLAIEESLWVPAKTRSSK